MPRRQKSEWLSKFSRSEQTHVWNAYYPLSRMYFIDGAYASVGGRPTGK